eukprot:424172_1
MSGNEIITIQMGACGNNMGAQFWERILGEHWLQKDGVFVDRQPSLKSEREKRLEKINVYFHERWNGGILSDGYIRQKVESQYNNLYIPFSIKKLCKHFIGSSGTFIPRLQIIDLDPTTTDNLKTSNLGSLFNSNNFIVGTSDASNNWAKGYHLSEEPELIDQIMNNIRYEVEDCDSFQGFQLCHSIGGGTGSGLGSRILQNMKDNYPNSKTCTFTVFPSPKVSDVVVEPYNATLSIDKLLSHSDETFVIDNNALFNISHNVMKIHCPKYAELNWVASLAMSGATSSLRYSIELNSNLRRLAVNMVPFPRFHFLLISQAPLFNHEYCWRYRLTMCELTDQQWSSRNFLANIRAEDGKYFAVASQYRGNLSAREIHDEIDKISQKMADDFIQWIPNSVMGSVNVVPAEDASVNGISQWYQSMWDQSMCHPMGSVNVVYKKNALWSGTLVANTTAMKNIFKRVAAGFAGMYKKKAYFHLYSSEGMEESDFKESDENVRDLITEYQNTENVVVESSDDEDDDDDDEDDEDEDEEEYDESEEYDSAEDF